LSIPFVNTLDLTQSVGVLVEHQGYGSGATDNLAQRGPYYGKHKTTLTAQAKFENEPGTGCTYLIGELFQTHDVATFCHRENLSRTNLKYAEQ
jgi:hypothetical protein